MTALVVDTSIAVKWYLDEDDSGQALTMLNSSIDFHAPDFLRLEFANAIWKNVLKGSVEPEVYDIAVPRLERTIARWHDPSPFIAEALRLGCALRHPIYDFVYLELARHLGIPLVTADKRFLAIAPKGNIMALADWKP